MKIKDVIEYLSKFDPESIILEENPDYRYLYNIKETGALVIDFNNVVEKTIKTEYITNTKNCEYVEFNGYIISKDLIGKKIIYWPL